MERREQEKSIFRRVTVSGWVGVWIVHRNIICCSYENSLLFIKLTFTCLKSMVLELRGTVQNALWTISHCLKCSILFMFGTCISDKLINTISSTCSNYCEDNSHCSRHCQYDPKAPGQWLCDCWKTHLWPGSSGIWYIAGNRQKISYIYRQIHKARTSCLQRMNISLGRERKYPELGVGGRLF